MRKRRRLFRAGEHIRVGYKALLLSGWKGEAVVVRTQTHQEDYSVEFVRLVDGRPEELSEHGTGYAGWHEVTRIRGRRRELFLPGC